MAEAWAAARRNMTAAVLRVNVSFMVQGMFECRDFVLCQWGVGSREWGVGSGEACCRGTFYTQCELLLKSKHNFSTSKISHVQIAEL
jgi:hypothetical protein